MRTSGLLAGIAHGFTGRAEGDLRPPAPEASARLVAALGGDGALRTVSQVHGARVVGAGEADGRTEADAIVSAEPGVVVAVRVADCVPILLAAPGVVAAVHAGWRGTAADVTRATLRAVRERTRGEVRAAVGPCICGRCYEVGDEVIAAVGRVAPGRAWLDGRRVDLAEANAAILRDEGVAVDVLGVCTRCDEGYWSFRRDGAAGGRQAGAIRC
ncbi:MAG: polyphenol oxidase family protein [Myxococcota bacterium]